MPMCSPLHSFDHLIFIFLRCNLSHFTMLSDSDYIITSCRLQGDLTQIAVNFNVILFHLLYLVSQSSDCQ